jgi:hypothetical protein
MVINVFVTKGIYFGRLNYDTSAVTAIPDGFCQSKSSHHKSFYVPQKWMKLSSLSIISGTMQEISAN